jgi:CPA2 family monovalent cation:H+ antiporter-2
MTAVLLDIAIIFALSVVAAVICHRLRIPTSVGMLLAGVLAGPHLTGLVQNRHEIEIIAEIGVVLLLFVIGLEFSLREIGHLKRQFLLGGSLQFWGTAAVVGFFTVVGGTAVSQSVYLGFVVALSSTAIVLKLLQDRAELDAPQGRAALAMLIYQDIAVVPLLLLAPLLAGSLGTSVPAELLGFAARVLAVGAFAYVAFRWLVPWVLERITATRSSEAFLLGVIALCVGIALFTQSLGLSLALGAFLAGLIISESEYSHQAVAVILPFRDVFMSLFFVSIGLLLDVEFLLANPLRIAVLTLGILLIKPVVATAASLVTGLPLRYAILGGLALGQVGEFSLVATQVGVTSGLLSEDMFQTVLDTAVLTMLVTPVLFAIGPKVADLARRTPLSRFERRKFSPMGVTSEHSYENHVLIVGFGVTGQNVARTARLTEVPYAILDLNAATVRAALDEGEPIHFGDATHESILRHVDADKARAIVVVVDDRAASRRITELARRIAPEAYILARSRYLREVEPLRDAGADEVIADELEVSIEIFARVLARMLVPREDIKRLIGDVRSDWRRMARGFASHATSVSDLRVNIPDMITHTLRISDTSPLGGVTVAESGLRSEHSVTILAVSRDDETLGNPKGDTVLAVGDVLFVIGPIDWDPRTVS